MKISIKGLALNTLQRNVGNRVIVQDSYGTEYSGLLVNMDGFILVLEDTRQNKIKLGRAIIRGSNVALVKIIEEGH